jgi:hypothetical protein
VTHEAKTLSAASNRTGGENRGIVRRSLAGPAGAKGTGAPSYRHLRVHSLVALAISLIALFATAAQALAAPPTVTTPVVSTVSYGTAHLSGEVNAHGSFIFATFEYCADALECTDNANWTQVSAGFLAGSSPEPVHADPRLSSATEYFVRLKATNAITNEEALSPGPNPSFTTLAADPPTIPGAVGTSSVFSTSATATAKVKRPTKSDDVRCHFEYVTDAQFEENVNVNSQPGFTGATPVDCEQNPIGEADAETEKEVTANLTGLSASTAYHLRLVAENATPDPVTKDAAATFTTLAPVAKPLVLAAADAFEITKVSAKASGEVERPAGEDPALDVNCRFEYVTDAQFTANPPGEEFAGAGQAPCVENPIASPAPGHPAVKAAVEAELSGLSGGTTYHLRLAAENGGGTATKEAAATFTTEEFVTPTVTIDPPTGYYTTADVSGTVNPEGGLPGLQYAVFYAFEYSTEPDNPSSWIPSNLTSRLEPPDNESATPVPVGETIEGLQPGTTYYVRLSAQQYGEPTVGFSPEPNPSFTTGSVDAPSASDLAVSAVTGTTAHFSGTVDANAPGPLSTQGEEAFAAHWHFQCNPECPGLTGTVEAGEGSQVVEADATGLGPDTTYEVTLEATNAGGTAAEGPETFATTTLAPTIKAAPGGSDGNGGYTLQGVVNPHNSIVECEFVYGPISDVDPKKYAFAVPCSPTPGEVNKPVTVEGHVTGLTPGATYHSRLVVSNSIATEVTDDQTFIPTLDQPQPCANEALRKENSSLALPECRAYEMVTPPDKAGADATLSAFTTDGSSIRYESNAGNIANSGQGALLFNSYVANRTDAGWQTTPNLNGPNGSLYAPPYELTPLGESVLPVAYTADLQHSIYFAELGSASVREARVYLRNPDGSFTYVGNGNNGPGSIGSGGTGSPHTISRDLFVGGSDDFSHVVLDGASHSDEVVYGPGVYEFVGTGNAQPRRIDVDNTGSQISSCTGVGGHALGNAAGNAVSADGRVILFTVAGGCGGANPPARALWARVGGTTSVDVSASQCTRIDCNAPADAVFQGAAKDGSRVYFDTTQQLVNGDTDQTNDLYACDIPPGTPAPSTGTSDPCSSLSQVSAGDPSGAEVEEVAAISSDGSSVYFVARGDLADNAGALNERALAGNHNLYLWRTDAAHLSGQTTFVARLDSDDLEAGGEFAPQATRDGRDLVFGTANQLVPTDTDEAGDVYRYDAVNGELTRVSTNVFGVAGNDHGVDARFLGVSDDGGAIVFSTGESLSPADGNGEPDVYLWKDGHASLISTGSVGGGIGQFGRAAIDASGRDVFFTTAQSLTPADSDSAVDVYDARVGGGFGAAQATRCAGAGGACQTHSPSPLPAPDPATGQPGEGNVKHCPKNKVAKGKRCVKKPHRKDSAKRRHGKKASHRA